MKGQDLTQQRSPRPEKAAGRSGRLMLGLFGIVMLIANASRLSRDGSPWTVAAVVVATVIPLYWWNHMVAGGLRELDSLEELSEAVSQSKGQRRAYLVWYEYVIARNVARGTYAGERPWDFKDDVYAATRGMGAATPSSQRQVYWLFGTMAVLALGASLWFSEGDPVLLLMMLGFFGAVVAVSAGVTLLFLRWAARGPVAALGRRVDEAAGLPTRERWESLLLIARDENALRAAHS